MKYTVQEIARLAGVTPRTIRFYDRIDLLKPAEINQSGYRLYGKCEIDRLQQIMFFRELDFSLENIKSLLADPNFDYLDTLYKHQASLRQRRARLDVLLANLEKTIALKEGTIMLSDEQRFTGFKKELVAQNREKYGKEVSEKYGEEALKNLEEKLLKMKETEYLNLQELEKMMLEKLIEAQRIAQPEGNLAFEAAELHRKWLSGYWGTYSKEAHREIAETYVQDERFGAYYDKHSPGLAVFLRDVIVNYVDKI